MTIKRLSKNHFDALKVRWNASAKVTEKVWFGNNSQSFIGMVLHENGHEEWGFLIFTRDDRGGFEPAFYDCGFPEQRQAEDELIELMSRADFHLEQ